MTLPKNFETTVSETVEWETPAKVFDALWEVFGPFDCDPACRIGQYTAKRVLENGGLVCIAPDSKRARLPKRSPGAFVFDGLKSAWRRARKLSRVFLNPPYGRDIKYWIAKAKSEVENGHCELVCALLPARTDTRWFHDLIFPSADEIIFLRGRITFDGAPAPAKFPSMVVIWRANSTALTVRSWNVNQPITSAFNVENPKQPIKRKGTKGEVRHG